MCTVTLASVGYVFYIRGERCVLVILFDNRYFDKPTWEVGGESVQEIVSFCSCVRARGLVD